MQSVSACVCMHGWYTLNISRPISTLACHYSDWPTQIVQACPTMPSILSSINYYHSFAGSSCVWQNLHDCLCHWITWPQTGHLCVNVMETKAFIHCNSHNQIPRNQCLCCTWVKFAIIQICLFPTLQSCPRGDNCIVLPSHTLQSQQSR